MTAYSLLMTTSSGATIPAPDEQSVVLVIEDDPALNSTLCYNLRRDGYLPLSAADGEEGLKLFLSRSDDIRAVILDLMLPRMSGMHVLRNIRQRSSTPVLILSARGQEQDKIDGLDLGADDYIVKPFSIRELSARLRAMLRRNPVIEAGGSSVVERGALRIDTIGQRATVNGMELVLRPKEYGLLLTLAMSAGKVFSRQELLDSVWGDDIYVDARTVDVHVSWLRGKLRRAGLSEQPIQTAYGSGYRFSPIVAAASTSLESHRQIGGDIQADQLTRPDIQVSKEIC